MKISFKSIVSALFAITFTVSAIAQTKVIEHYKIPLTQADTTIILINISDLDKDGTANILNFLSDKGAKAIGLHYEFSNEEGDDAVLVQAMQKVKDKLVLTYRLEKMGKEEANYLKGFDYGPSLIYLNKKDEVEAFGLNYEADNGERIETFYLKLMKKADPAYSSFDQNNRVYPIQYLGNKLSFPILDHDMLEHTLPHAFTDKIVLIGYLGQRDRHFYPVSDDIDAFFTPTSRAGVPKKMPNMYGTVITANILSLIFRDSSFKP